MTESNLASMGHAPASAAPSYTAAATPALDRRWFITPLVLFAFTRILLLAVAYLAEAALPGNAGSGYWRIFPDNALLDMWVRWDSGFYLIIAQDYDSLRPTAFFPLYPVTMRLLAPLTGGNFAAAGLIVSHAALLGSCLYLYLLARLETSDDSSAARAVLYLTIFPAGFFFAAVYTESLFLFCTVAAVYHARRQDWGWAACFGTLATATRLVGILIYGVVLLEWMASHGWSFRTALRRATWQRLGQAVQRDWLSLLIIQIIPLGLLSYIVYLSVRFADPLAFMHAQEYWPRGDLRNPLIVLSEAVALVYETSLPSGIRNWNVVVDSAAAALVILLIVPVWRRVRPSYALYMAGSALIPLMTSTMSFVRYAAVLFPIYLILAQWGRRPMVDRIITVTFAMLLAVLTAAFVNWMFVA